MAFTSLGATDLCGVVGDVRLSYLHVDFLFSHACRHIIIPQLLLI